MMTHGAHDTVSGVYQDDAQACAVGVSSLMQLGDAVL